MKKFIILFIMFMSFEIKVYATNIEITLSCPQTVYINSPITCSIYSNSTNGKLSGLKGNFEITNGTFSEFKSGGLWTTYASNDKGFVVGNTSGGISNKSTIGTIKINNNLQNEGEIIVKLTNLNASDSDYTDFDIPNRQANIKVIKKQVTILPLLDSLEIEGYKLPFNPNINRYEIEVKDNLKEINIKATSKNNKISGIGNYELKEEINKFQISVQNENNKNIYNITIKKTLPSSNIIENDETKIQKAIQVYDEIIINLDEKNDSLLTNKTILEKIKSTDKKIIYEIKNNDKLKYKYIFNGKDIDYILEDINLKINFIDSIENNILSENALIIDTIYKGFYPKGTLIAFPTTITNNIKLYKFNIENNIELINNNLKKNDGMIEINIEKGGKYIIDNISKNDNIENNKKYIICFMIITIISLIVNILITLKYKKVKIQIN